MEDRRDEHSDLQARVAEFERENPKVSEAMRLFGMTMERYDGAMNALYAPRVYQSDSTQVLPQRAAERPR